MRQRLNKILAEIDEGSFLEPTKMTVGQWFDIWLSEHTADKKYATIKHYKAQYRSHIKPNLDAVKLAELTAPMIQTLYNNLGSGGDQKKPLSPKSVRNVHGIMSKALSTAVRLGYIRTNQATLVTLPRVVKKEIQPLNDKQVRDFLRAAGEDSYGLLLKLVLFTGLRESEAIGLTWDCVHFESSAITINKQLQKRPIKDGGFTYAPLKNDKVRILNPAPYVMKLLELRRSEENRQRLRAGEL